MGKPLRAAPCASCPSPSTPPQRDKQASTASALVHSRHHISRLPLLSQYSVGTAQIWIGVDSGPLRKAHRSPFGFSVASGPRVALLAALDGAPIHLKPAAAARLCKGSDAAPGAPGWALLGTRRRPSSAYRLKGPAGGLGRDRALRLNCSRMPATPGCRLRSRRGFVGPAPALGRERIRGSKGGAEPMSSCMLGHAQWRICVTGVAGG